MAMRRDALGPNPFLSFTLLLSSASVDAFGALRRDALPNITVHLVPHTHDDTGSDCSDRKPSELD